MGINQSCNNIRLQKDNICNIGHCTQKVKGLSSNSASPTDVWFLTLQPNTKYGDTLVTGDVSLKIYLNPNMKSLELNGKKIPKNNTKELLYETNVYEHVIGPMLEYKINPHFVTFYGSADNCSFAQLFNILEDKTANKINDEIIDNNLLEKLFIRNTIWMGTSKSNRPSINNPSFSRCDPKEIDHVLAKKDLLKYNMIATAKSQETTLYNWFKKHNNKFPDSLAEVAIIQIVSALASLELFECAHNDLHRGNIFVNEFENDKIITYVSNNDFVYSIDSNICVLLYDWDRSYVSCLGQNSANTKSMCKYYSGCNEYVPSRDILKIFVSILRDITDNKYKMGIMSSIFMNGGGMAYFLKNVYSKDDSNILYDKKTETTLSKQWITQNVNPPKIILRNLIYFFNNPHITINNLSGDIYDFSDKNFKQILESVSEGKDISILNFNTKRDKETGTQEYTVKSPKRKSPKRKSPKRKSPKRKSPKPCKDHQYRNPETNRCKNKDKSPKRKSPKRKSPKRKSPKRKSPKPCKDHQYRNPETNRCKNKHK